MKQPISAFAIIVILISAVSCQDRIRLVRDGSLTQLPMINPSILSRDLSEVKSGSSAGTLTRVFGGDDDGFTIEEYVSDIDDFMPATKGTEIKQPDALSGNFNVSGNKFQVMAFLDSLKANGEYDHKNEFNLESECNASKKWNWNLTAVEKAPCWRTSTDYSIWSYWPISANGRSGIDENSVTDWKNRASSTSKLDYNSLTFTHTVPQSLEDQKDLLFAYNYEHRDFKTDAQGNYPIDPITKKPIFELVDGQKSTYDVKFYHALAAVKFVLNSTTSGADVHSITLCCTENTTGHNIKTDDGIATTGSCTATGNPASPGDKVTFTWTDQDGKKPLHYEFGSSQSVAGGYTQTGDGVLFMIPQDIQNVKIIVEFSRNGSTKYYTRIQTLDNVTWEAGKYYTYKLSIGEFHVPGERMAELTDVHIRGLKPQSGATSFKRPETPISIKGVTRMGLIITGYGLGTKPGQTVHMYSNAYATDNSVPPAGSGFQFDFVNYTDITGTDMISFGDGTTETYYDKYTFAVTESQNKNPASNGVEAYYVFNTNNKDTFFLYFRQDAGDNSGGFHAWLKGLYVVEVAKDPDFPANFPLNPWP